MAGAAGKLAGMTPPASLTASIYQGTTFDFPLERVTYPYPVRWECGRLVKKCSGAIAPDADATREDYTGCTAIAQFLRDGNPQDVIFTLTTEDGGIVLNGAWLWLKMTKAQTLALQHGDAAPAWTQCVARVTVFRPTGEAEPQYELPVLLFPWRQEP